MRRVLRFPAIQSFHNFSLFISTFFLSFLFSCECNSIALRHLYSHVIIVFSGNSSSRFFLLTQPAEAEVDGSYITINRKELLTKPQRSDWARMHNCLVIDVGHRWPMLKFTTIFRDAFQMSCRVNAVADRTANINGNAIPSPIFIIYYWQAQAHVG